jgi:hypothetical protein
MMGIAPVNSAPVNDPKNSAVRGANVVMSAPQASGTTIIPPGILSIVCLILIAVSLARNRDSTGMGAPVEV